MLYCKINMANRNINTANHIYHIWTTIRPNTWDKYYNLGMSPSHTTDARQYYQDGVSDGNYN